jgi:hippurate hydrolase
MNPDTASMNHSDTAVFDDSVLVDGARIYAQLALKRLKLRSGDTPAPP